MNIFAVRLKQKRELQGLTQKEMAEALGISFRTYQNYESRGKNHHEPPQETLIRIADILNTTVDSLLGRTTK